MRVKLNKNYMRSEYPASRDISNAGNGRVRIVRVHIQNCRMDSRVSDSSHCVCHCEYISCEHLLHYAWHDQRNDQRCKKALRLWGFSNFDSLCLFYFRPPLPIAYSCCATRRQNLKNKFLLLFLYLQSSELTESSQEVEAVEPEAEVSKKEVGVSLPMCWKHISLT